MPPMQGVISFPAGWSVPRQKERIRQVEPLLSSRLDAQSGKVYAERILAKVIAVIKQTKNLDSKRAILYVVNDSVEAAKIVTNRAVEMGIIGTDPNSIKRYYDEELKNWNGASAAVTFPDLDLIVITLQKICEKFPKDEEKQKAYLVVTIIHEGVHYYGGLSHAYPKDKDSVFDLTPLMEGLVEYAAQKLSKRILAEENLPPAGLGAYTSKTDSLFEIARILCFSDVYDPIIACALGGSYDDFFYALRDAGINNLELFKLMRYCHELATKATNAQNYGDRHDRLMGHWRKIVNLLEKRLPDPSKISERTRLETICEVICDRFLEYTDCTIGVASLALTFQKTKRREGPIRFDDDFFYDPAAGRIEVDYEKMKLKYGVDCWKMAFFYTFTVSVYHNGNFGDYNNLVLEWLRNSYSLYLASTQLKLEGFSGLDERTARKLQPAALLAKLVGEDALQESFIKKSNAPIVKKLIEIGATEKEISDLFTAGHECVYAWSTARFMAVFLKLVRKRKRKDADEENYYQEFFGPLGEIASKNITAFRQANDSHTLNAARAVAIRQNLLCGPDAFQFGLDAYYLSDFRKSDSQFHDRVLRELLAPYLRLTSRYPKTPGALVASLARNFEDQYGVKPSLKQLFAYAADQIRQEFTFKPADALESLKSQLTASEYAEVCTGVSLIPVEFSKKLFLHEKGDLELLSSCAGIGEVKTPNIAVLVAFKHNILTPTLADVVATAVALKIESRKNHADIEGLINGQLNCYPLEPQPPAPAINMSVPILPKKRITKEDAIKYLSNRGLDPSLHHDILVLCEKLNLAYPSKVIELHERFGIRLYDNTGYLYDIDAPVAKSDNTATMGKLEPYGIGPVTDLPLLNSGRRIKQAVRKAIKDCPAAPKSLPKQAAKTISRVHTLSTIVDKYSGATVDTGIQFSADGYRPNGSFTAEEVLEHGYAVCLEYTYLFLAFAKELAYARALGFKVFEDEEGNMMPHICGGIVVGEDPFEQRLFETLVLTTSVTPYALHYVFDGDPTLKTKVLGVSGFQGPNSGLALIDLSRGVFSPQYNYIVPATYADLVAAYYSNAGAYFIRRKDYARGIENLQIALRINPAEEMAKSHFVAYYSDIKPDPVKVIELTNDIDSIVNPEDLMSRALALIACGRVSDSIIAALYALQLSQGFDKARFFLEEIGFLGRHSN
ncbi:hypothetical protein HZC07_02690 [Candidatus Micrarchaeota archaeon]|nr:hypothetical protein [Candidatus Micrarchaeota archaeon]